jgi:hypothetical protein
MIFETKFGVDFNGCYVEFFVEYDASPYVPRTFDHPAEGGEIEEIRKVTIDYVEGFDRAGNTVYLIDGKELGDWDKDWERVIEAELCTPYYEASMIEYANDCMEDYR